jgi:hypothetical protein
LIDKVFCDFLESKLEEAFANSKNDQVKYFFCDGVLLPPTEKYYSKKSVNDNRRIEKLKVFAGVTGQDEYELILNFGRKALSRYALDKNIAECWDEMGNDWLKVDIEKKKIYIELN